MLLLQDDIATYRAMLAAIAEAHDHIHLETYILDDDEKSDGVMQHGASPDVKTPVWAPGVTAAIGL